MIARAKARNLPPQEIRFDYGEHDGKISSIEPLIGKSGWLTLSNFSVESLDQAEDHLIFAAMTDDGISLDEEAIPRLFTLPGAITGACSSKAPDSLATTTKQCQAVIQRTISERNALFFQAESEKLEGWADDLKLGLEREIKDIDRQIKEARRDATNAAILELKLAGQKLIKTLESKRNEKRRSLFDAQDKVDQQRGELIDSIEGKLIQNSSITPLFTIRWTLK